MTGTLSSVNETLTRADPTTRAAAPRPRLRARLVALDLGSLVVAWALALGTTAPAGGLDTRRLGAVAITITISLIVMRSQGLYRARVCAVRSVEIARLATAALVAAGTMAVVDHLGHQPVRPSEIAMGAGSGFVILTLTRGRYARWLGRARTADRYCRPTIIVGTGAESIALAKLLTLHPEVGLRAVGTVGPQPGTESSVRWLGGIDDTVECLRTTGSDSVLIAASDLAPSELNHLTRALTRAGVHVHLSSGLHGIASRRIRPLPIAREPLFYVEPVSLSRGNGRSSVPSMSSARPCCWSSPRRRSMIAALAVRGQDGGPAIFRQIRVGLGGRPFQLFKLRTMVTDAEAQLVDLTLRNEREGGPLFKLAQDPRRTPVGRILEKTSIDELPQLVNVLRGEMSLVGPRPALPHEVAQFSAELQGRHEVLPGITGLWQVEGRESAAFDLYERFDLFYVENWSVWLDIVIIVGTLRAVAARAWSPLAPEPRAPPQLRTSPTGAQQLRRVPTADAVNPIRGGRAEITACCSRRPTSRRTASRRRRRGRAPCRSSARTW